MYPPQEERELGLLWQLRSAVFCLLSHPACLLLLLLSSAHVAPSLHAKSKNPMAWTDEVEQETYSSQGALALNDHMTV